MVAEENLNLQKRMMSTRNGKYAVKHKNFLNFQISLKDN